MQSLNVNILEKLQYSMMLMFSHITEEQFLCREGAESCDGANLDNLLHLQRENQVSVRPHPAQETSLAPVPASNLAFKVALGQEILSGVV